MRISTVLILIALTAVALLVTNVRNWRRVPTQLRFADGDRVRMNSSYHWAKGATGTIEPAPPPVVALGGWRGSVRSVRGAHGLLTFYWVVFDQPQRDADGDRPYAGGEIDGEYLLPDR